MNNNNKVQMTEITDFLSKGTSNFDQGNYIIAAEYFQAVLESEPENESALLGMGKVYFKQGALNNAKKCYFRVLSTNPEQEEALSFVKSLFIEVPIIEVTENDRTEYYSEENDFRVAKWKDSMQEIMNKEGQKNLSQFPKEEYAFNTEVAGMNCSAIYCFTLNMLSTGIYSFTEVYSNMNKYINNYESLVALLTKKYGEPIPAISNNGLWYDDLWKDDYSQWGFAISMGHLSYMTRWELDRTTLTITLCGDNGKINFFIMYRSKELENLVQEKIEKNKLAGL